MLPVVALATLAVVASTLPAAAEVTVCGVTIANDKLISDRAAKWFGTDRKEKQAIGSFIVDCEADGARWIVSSPDGSRTHAYVVAYRYR